MKKRLSLCLVLILILSAMLVPAMSAEAAGNYTWSVADGVLTITGTGMVGPFSFASSLSSNITTEPWESYADEITSVVVGEGISYLGNLALSELYKMEEITLPSTLVGYSFGDNNTNVYSAFDLNRLARINWGGTTDQWIRLQSRSGYTAVNRSTHNLMYNNPTLYVDGKPLTELVLEADSPRLGYDALYNCADLTRLTVEDGYAGPIQEAFYGCTALNTVLFEGGAPEISDYAFSGVEATVSAPSLSARA